MQYRNRRQETVPEKAAPANAMTEKLLELKKNMQKKDNPGLEPRTPASGAKTDVWVKRKPKLPPAKPQG